MTSPDTSYSAPLVELFAQYDWHADGALRLNVEGAKRLIGALQRFIENGKQTEEVYSSDGEGYTLHIVPAEMHDDSRVNHYLNIPGVEPDCGDTLIHKLSQEAACPKTR